jgi:hypothetical protein
MELGGLETAGGPMSNAGLLAHFFIGSDDEVGRCKDSWELGRPIEINGTDTLTGRVREYAGIVRAIEPVVSGDLGERWRITIEPR